MTGLSPENQAAKSRLKLRGYSRFETTEKRWVFFITDRSFDLKKVIATFYGAFVIYE